MARRLPRGHNGGPPLDDEARRPPWGRGGFVTFFAWKAAHKAAWRGVSFDVMRLRATRADALGLTYEEYTLEILERGVHLQPEDADRIAAIKAARRGRRGARR